jgi:hypothetical protein
MNFSTEMKKYLPIAPVPGAGGMPVLFLPLLGRYPAVGVLVNLEC